MFKQQIHSSLSIWLTPVFSTPLAKSFIPSHRCYIKSNQTSSGFVFTNLSSQVRLVSLCFQEVLNRSNRCNSSPCQEKKKRKSRVKGVIRVPAVISKMENILANEYSWRKYGQNHSK
ncbi:unnamed protein product, partial [Eruca vesicaria subsp. sativa]|nr:unnamed protein product [Eruca vesicaria subsp. sativa]